VVPLERVVHTLEVLGEPEIIVAQVGNHLAVRLLERKVPGGPPVTLTLRKVEEADAPILPRELCNHRAGRIIHTVPDNEDLDVAHALAERTLDRVPEGGPMIMGRDEH